MYTYTAGMEGPDQTKQMEQGWAVYAYILSWSALQFRNMQAKTNSLKDVERRVRITKTCLYNFDPLKPHFYTVKLGLIGVYIIFLISVQNIDCGSNEYSQSMFWAEIWKISEFFIWKFSIFWW